MAIVSNDSFLKHFSGSLAKTLVFKQYKGKTIVAKRPAKPTRQTARQQASRNTFKRAAQWAKTVLADANQKQYYQQQATKLGLPNAYTAAVQEAMRMGSGGAVVKV